jgi:hypothetical protein
MNRINAADREKQSFEASKLELLQKQKQKQKVNAYKDRVLLRERNCQRVSGKCRCTKQSINSQEASALIVVTQHYDTLQAIGAETNSNLILLPNSPQAGSEMLNNMV